ncbi:phosphoenolpyruvate synthase [Allomuricauda ruestringensis DSM 13258]|uniref:Phosphoenolpyruvate synthase n=1 Tax=Allomuricauda ruestringensis (strain DSM 13258 / CIP 107369 / LMG 19739 / B1) TaxID=886377 RepID=G2PRQ7_ALLRU|nr:phosphoenolpyruvate synthase [Allomuricauda ruestringensis]AEM69506.1 phosphoenolpyruvate synthase [Allomuricauda ruestringensis DSM 13258]
MDVYIKPFKAIHIDDLPKVGGKNASLGEMYNELTGEGVRIPNGFATTSDAFWDFLDKNQLRKPLEDVLAGLDTDTYINLSEIGKKARELILSGTFSDKFSQKIAEAYQNLDKNSPATVAVRSSATAEDLPGASFAGQHDTFLNIKGEKPVLEAVKKCFASLYTDRAIKYRNDKGFKHADVALSVGVQQMVRAGKGCSGVGFTIEPESGFENVILLSGVWGLGENIVQGNINPDEFYIFKPTLKTGHFPILQKKKGDKRLTMIYNTEQHGEPTLNIKTPVLKQIQFVLSDDEIVQLAQWALAIEKHYQKPMDIEWAKDGLSGELFIIQARPETVHQGRDMNIYIEYKLLEKGTTLTSGNAVGSKIKVGTVLQLESPKEAKDLTSEHLIVTDTITPDWDPLLKQVGGIITNKGGRTSHAAIVARELGVPAIVGCGNATDVLSNGQNVTLSCAQGKTGYIYNGALKFEETKVDFSNIHLPDTEVKMILSDPESAFQLSFYPNNGVGLLRMEFIITHSVKIHPMALVNFDNIKNKGAKKEIETLTKGYPKRTDYFIDQLSEGIATIAAAFYPKEVIVRLSDFKTNEYANLIGGKDFEPKEENPMLGFRGASRYYNKRYKDGFALECAAIKRVRDTMGLTNLKVMVPFCRTLLEGKKVLLIMEENGLKRGENGLEVYTMVEIPSNVILAEEFAQIFDGFSIGSNDLTQLTLGIDRDSEIMGGLFDENDPAAKKMISMAISSAKKTETKIGLCGQAPSDFPEFAAFLVDRGINSISFNPDALLKGIKNISKAEKRMVDRKNTFLA